MLHSCLPRSRAPRGSGLPSGGFLNVDLEIAAPCDLAPLLAAIEPRLVVLVAEIRARRSWLRAESLLAHPRSASQAILDIARVVSRLRGQPRALWNSSSRRVFDIGYEAGTVRTPLVDLLDPDALAAITRVGAQLAITVYPAELGTREAPKRRRSARVRPNAR